MSKMAMDALNKGWNLGVVSSPMSVHDDDLEQLLAYKTAEAAALKHEETPAKAKRLSFRAWVEIFLSEFDRRPAIR